jgi:hypothetical protein
MPKFFDRFNSYLIEEIETKFKSKCGIEFSEHSRDILNKKLNLTNIAYWNKCIALFEEINRLGVESLRWLIDALEQGLTPKIICNVLNQLNNVQLLNLKVLMEIKGKTAYGEFLSYLNEILNEAEETVPLQSKQRVIKYLLSLDKNQIESFCLQLHPPKGSSFQAKLETYLEDLKASISLRFMQMHIQGSTLPASLSEFEKILDTYIEISNDCRKQPILDEWLDIAERLQIICCKLKEQNIGEDNTLRYASSITLINT